MITAVQAIRRMRGGAQSQLMLGDDGDLWVVKFRNNPQHPRVLPNEFISTRIAEAVGLTVPRTAAVQVSSWLVEHTPEMVVDKGRGVRERCADGWQFGSKFVGGLMPGQVVDYLPDSQLNEVRNLTEFAGILAVDKWTGNCNGRQAVYERKPRERKYRAVFIDQGFCFNAGEWTFPDVAMRGVFPRNLVYARVRGWENFEPWLTKVEEFRSDNLMDIAGQMPPEWYENEVESVQRLMDTLYARRGKVRDLITAFRDSSRDPFPNWGRAKHVAVPHGFEALGQGPQFVM